MALLDPPDGSLYQFPVIQLYDLEERIFKDRWVVPLQPWEPLAVGMACALKCAALPTWAADEGCQRFVNHALTHTFEKLLDSTEVHNWNAQIQEKIAKLTKTAIDLVVASIPHDSKSLLEIFARVSVFVLGKKGETKQSTLSPSRALPLRPSTRRRAITSRTRPRRPHLFLRVAASLPSSHPPSAARWAALLTFSTTFATRCVPLRNGRLKMLCNFFFLKAKPLSSTHRVAWMPWLRASRARRAPRSTAC